MIGTDVDKLKEGYARDGFAIVRNVVDPELIKEASYHVAWLGEAFPDLRPEEYHHPLMRNDAFWVRVVTDDRLVDIAEAFLGPDIACFTAHYICKPPVDGQPVLWHQDGAYWNLDPMEALTVWLAVDESSVENGCLWMIPGSHRAQLYAPESRAETPNMLFSATPENFVRDWLSRAGEVAVELAPGDVSIHHPHVLHHSKPNTSPKRRCGLDIGYMATPTRISNEGLYLDPILVRGSPVEGVNTYRKYPDWVPGQTIAFRGQDEWHLRAARMNEKHQFSDLDRDESPVQMTRRMIGRLQEGTVKR
jgi:phytanoyl-CoA hydroxylase